MVVNFWIFSLNIGKARNLTLTQQQMIQITDIDVIVKYVHGYRSLNVARSFLLEYFAMHFVVIRSNFVPLSCDLIVSFYITILYLKVATIHHQESW